MISIRSPGRKHPVDAAGRIRDDEPANSEAAEDPGGESDLRHGIPLIKVDRSLQRNHRDPLHGSADQVAGMTRNRGDGEMRDFAEGQDRPVLERIRIGAKSGAKDQAHDGCHLQRARMEARVSAILEYTGSLGDCGRGPQSFGKAKNSKAAAAGQAKFPGPMRLWPTSGLGAGLAA